MAGVILKNVSKSYGKNLILDDINLEIKDREFCVLVGASGCGKSTLLRMIAGLESVTRGKVFIGEKCVNDVHPRDRDVAMVFQSYALYPQMNVYENMAFPLKMRSVKKNEIQRRVKNAAEILGLTEYLKRKPRELSGGQRQRVALGRAIVREPAIFLMDEPLSNLDAKLRVQMRSEIKRLHKALKTTFIYVTHDQVEALTMGDRIAVLDGGKVQQIDTPQNIYAKPDNIFVATFMGASPMNIIPAEVDEDGILNIENAFVQLDEYQKRILNGRSEILLGLRPEAIVHQKCFFNYNSTLRFNAHIEFDETLGSQKLVYFHLNGAKCSARTESFVDTSHTLEFCADMKEAHFFDKESGMRLE